MCHAVDIGVDVGQTYQTIDGFGFFGPKDVWWNSSNPSHFYDQTWLDLVVDSLGITIWRNEYYSEESNQDANWAQQRPMVEALKAKADASGVPLRFFYSVWSPPSAMKCEGTNGCWGDPTTAPHPEGLKNGGVLCEASQTAYGNWLVEGISKYEQSGIDLYAISFQNEPLFCQFYNSCFFGYSYYRDVLKVVGPIVKAAYPNVKILGAEHMLSANMYDGKSQFPYIYESAIMRDPVALQQMDIWAYHGYSDGVNPIPGSEMATLWALVRDSLARAGSRPIWMTETSGYDDTWGTGGALELAGAMFAALQYGNLAGWVHWYGHGNWIQNGTTLTKRGQVARHFCRYVRPGAVRVDVGATGSSEVHVLAFQHTGLNNFIVLALNVSSSPYTVSLTGNGLPTSFTLYRTSATEDCAEQGTVQADNIVLASSSLNTLVSGSVYGTPVKRGHSPDRAHALRRGTVVQRMHAVDGRIVNRAQAPGAYVVSVRGPTGNVYARKMVVQPR
jgi:O-glycosyl hydrolase